MLDNLKKYRILLASKSPRRHELLRQLHIPFTLVALGGIKEEYPPETPLDQVAQTISEVKANAYQGVLKDNELIITADTVVICNGKIYGKPKDTAEAEQMLRELAGKTHQVATGVTLSTIDRRTSFTVITDVTFGPLSEEEIHYYVEEYMPLDKAGAYGIQEWIGAVAVESIHGSFYNVMGLPVQRLYQELKLF